MRTLRLACSISLMLLTAVLSGQAEDAIFRHEEGAHLDVLQRGKPIVRYMYGYDTSTPERRLETYKPWHHVFDPEGKDFITKGPGGKYPHHRAIYIGWNKLGHGGKVWDLWHMRGQAAQVHQKFIEKRADQEKALVSTLVHWITDGSTVAIEETRTATVHFDDPSAHLLLDFTSECKAADGDVVLSGDPEHAGMQYRPHNDVVANKSASYTFHAEGIDPKKDHDLPWVAMTYELNGRTYTVQHMNHPKNPKGTRYSAYRDYGRFGAYPKTSIKDGETLLLRYGIRITLGEPAARSELQKQYDQFIKR